MSPHLWKEPEKHPMCYSGFYQLPSYGKKSQMCASNVSILNMFLTSIFCRPVQTSSPAAVSGAVEGPHTSGTRLQPPHHPGPAQQSQSTHKGEMTGDDECVC